MKLFPLLFALSSVATPQGFEATAALDADVDRLFWARGATNVSFSWNELGVAGCPAPQQIGTARGFAGANGFTLTNGWLEALDDDGASTSSPGGCIDAEGGVGGLDCASTDAALAAALSDLNFTQDAANATITFTLANPTTLRFGYEFLTFEDPTDATFFDGFAILVDGTLVAGGTTRSGPEASTDPWTLSPSIALPEFEFQSLAPGVYHQVPARCTGRRDLALALGAGTHTLSFHVADSRSGGTGLGCGAASDQLVNSALTIGLHEFYGSDTGVGVTSGTTLGNTRWETVGHPAPAGRFGSDFQLVLEGVDANAITLLFVSPQPVATPVVLSVHAPLELLLAIPSLVYSEIGFGSVAFPPSGPIQVPAIAEGSTLVYQAFGIDLADGRVFASPA